MNTDSIELLAQLIRCPSVTPTDHGCQQIIKARLERAGFTIESMLHGEVNNLWARIGNDAPLFVFAGHTDVVPVGDVDQWSNPPFAADIVDGHLVGRGAADMKGSIAAMLTAAERFLATNNTLAGSIGFLITGDEEGPAVDGTARVVEALDKRNEVMDYCLVGEPTSRDTLGDTIKNGRRGSLSAKLIVEGVQGHVAYPHLADNPVHKAFAMLQELVTHEWDNGDEHFPPTTLQISNIHAGTGAGNVIPGTLTVDFNLRYSPATTVAHVQQTVEALIKEHQLGAQVTWHESASPFLTPTGSLTDAMKQAIALVTGVDAQLETGGGTSDGRFIAKTCKQVIEFGPLNATIHQVDERISCEDIKTLSVIYEQLLELLLV